MNIRKMLLDSLTIALAIALGLYINQYSTNNIPAPFFIGLSSLVIVLLIFLYCTMAFWVYAIIKKTYCPESVDDENAMPNYLGASSHQCIHHPNRYCSASDLIDSDFYDKTLDELDISDETLKEFNLVTDEVFNVKEREFFDKCPGGEIWVLSKELETEIELDKDVQESSLRSDPSLRQSMKVVKENIAKGNKYVQFVVLGNNETAPSYTERKNIYWEARPDLKTNEERQEAMPIVRIDSSKIGHGSLPGQEKDWTYMISLTSTVLFKNKRGGFEGYICLRPESKPGRKDREYKTIFYKMPAVCMSDEITKVLDKGLKQA